MVSLVGGSDSVEDDIVVGDALVGAGVSVGDDVVAVEEEVVVVVDGEDDEVVEEEEDEEFSSAMQAQDRPDKPPAPIDGGDNETSADRRRTAVARGKQPEVDQPVRESFSN